MMIKLAAVTFDDIVVIPLGKDVGGGLARQDLRESSFRAEDGWRIGLTTVFRSISSSVVFEIWREGMPRPAFVGGYGHTYVEADEPLGSVTVTSIDATAGSDPANTVTIDESMGPPTLEPTKRRKR